MPHVETITLIVALFTYGRFTSGIEVTLSQQILAYDSSPIETVKCLKEGGRLSMQVN